MEEINKEEVNRYLTEKMGLCWHEGMAGETMGHYICEHCDNPFYDEDVRDYFSPEGFFICLNWAKGEDWWWKFILEYRYKDWFEDMNLTVEDYDGCIPDDLINPEVLPIEVYNYLRGREK